MNKNRTVTITPAGNGWQVEISPKKEGLLNAETQEAFDQALRAMRNSLDDDPVMEQLRNAMSSPSEEEAFYNQELFVFVEYAEAEKFVRTFFEWQASQS